MFPWSIGYSMVALLHRKLLFKSNPIGSSRAQGMMSWRSVMSPLACRGNFFPHNYWSPKRITGIVPTLRLIISIVSLLFRETDSSYQIMSPYIPWQTFRTWPWLNGQIQWWQTNYWYWLMYFKITTKRPGDYQGHGLPSYPPTRHFVVMEVRGRTHPSFGIHVTLTFQKTKINK